MYEEGEIEEHVVAYEGIMFDQRESRRAIQLQINEELRKKVEEDLKVANAPREGLVNPAAYKKPGMFEDAYITRSDGKKIKALTYVDKEQAFLEMDAKKQEE